SFHGVPETGFVTHSTIGLVLYPLNYPQGGKFPGRQEYLLLTTEATAACASALTHVAAYCCFYRRVMLPGEVMQNLFEKVSPGTTVPHGMVTDPFVWQKTSGGLDTLTVRRESIYWLMVIPISDRELRLRSERGEAALSERLAAVSPDVTDMR